MVEDTGWGLVIYHHDADGKWRVARDAWGPITQPNRPRSLRLIWKLNGPPMFHAIR